ncbi:Rne/Rng family ribonuclease [Niallia sp. Krafla_26]|uniref:Rne/Rng family ribonuclease n=1 Tax=Niallia sp. Krafla_26 TaxID=3064703 RepID=UPI003D18689E
MVEKVHDEGSQGHFGSKRAEKVLEKSLLTIKRGSKMKKLIVNVLTREKRFALLDGSKVEKLEIKQPKHTSRVGNIYLGTITKVLPGMNAAFVDIGEEKNGYIHRDKLASFVLADGSKEEKEKKGISSFVHQGEKLLVQVEKDATGTKGPKLSSIIELSGEHLIYMPKGKYIAVSKKIQDSQNLRQFGYHHKTEEEGFIFRTSSANANEEELMIEIEQLRSHHEHLEKKAKTLKKPGLVLEHQHFFHELVEVIRPIAQNLEVVIDDRSLLEKLQNVYPSLQITLHTGYENIFSAYHLHGETEKALKRMVWLSNGAYLVMDEVEALTIIDVNTGKFSGKQDLADTVLKTNLLAAEEAARQIRLRDLAGMILIDFIDMKNEKERNQVQERITEELRKDGRQTRIVGFTALGILQLTRKRTKNSLAESLMEKCPVCEGTGKLPSTETVAFRLERELYEYRNQDVEKVIIESTEHVKRVFCGEQNEHKKRLEEILKFTIEFKINENVQPFYNILQLKS